MDKDTFGGLVVILGCYALGSFLGYQAGKSKGRVEATFECTKALQDSIIDGYREQLKKSIEKEGGES